MEIYYTFKSTHDVIRAEAALMKAGIKVKVRPIPNAIKTGCGLSLCIESTQKEIADKELEKNAISITATYIQENNKFHPHP